MKYVEIVAGSGSVATIRAIAEKVRALDFRLGPVDETDQQQSMRLLVSDDSLQNTLDLLQNVLGAQPSARITVLQVETYLPKPEPKPREQPDKAAATRESLYDQVAKSAHLDFNYLLLVVLSTIVAAIGLIENNIAVVIGAMVIAPLLSPNLALSLGTALGDLRLMRQAAQTLLAGIALVLGLSAIIGLAWDGPVDSPELLLRTEASWDSVALALASGAAAALSLTSGLSSVLVGVMVAVALLPPAATAGIMLGNGNQHLALGAALLLAINVVCVNLASKMVFYARNVRPRTVPEKAKARGTLLIYVLGWLVALVLLGLAIYARRALAG